MLYIGSLEFLTESMYPLASVSLLQWRILDFPSIHIGSPCFPLFSYRGRGHAGLKHNHRKHDCNPALSLSSVKSLSHVRLFEIPWTVAHQASLSITNSQSLLKLMSIELVMPSNHLILCCPLLLLPSVFPTASGSFSMSHFFASGGQSIGVSASASVLPVNIQDWFPLGLTGLISLKSEGLSRVLSSTTVQKHQFFSVQLSAILPSSVLTGCPGTIRESNTWRETRCYMTHPWEGRSRFWKKLTTKATA